MMYNYYFWFFSLQELASVPFASDLQMEITATAIHAKTTQLVKICQTATTAFVLQDLQEKSAKVCGLTITINDIV